jgi:hypothetical protein
MVRFVFFRPAIPNGVVKEMTNKLGKWILFALLSIHSSLPPGPPAQCFLIASLCSVQKHMASGHSFCSLCFAVAHSSLQLFYFSRSSLYASCIFDFSLLIFSSALVRLFTYAFLYFSLYLLSSFKISFLFLALHQSPSSYIQLLCILPFFPSFVFPVIAVSLQSSCSLSASPSVLCAL